MVGWRRIIRCGLLALVLAALLAPRARVADVLGRVVAISDGDTSTVLTDARQQVKVRLFGIDTPERAQSYGTRAQQGLSELAFGK